MRRLIALAVLAALVLSGCSSAQHGTGVPSLAGAGGGGAAGAGTASASKSGVSRPRVGYSTTRVAQLHAAAQCIREHGVPSYADPVLSAGGYVYTDSRSIQDIGAQRSQADQQAMLDALRQACGQLFITAGLLPDDESPAPPQLVSAGVRSAQCLRANGLPNMRDPNSESPFTPGHGFGLSADELPNNGALGKQDPAVQRAFTACRSLLDAEIRASTLSSLAHD
jgi:opacity protein-like surface antigen